MRIPRYPSYFTFKLPENIVRKACLLLGYRFIDKIKPLYEPMINITRVAVGPYEIIDYIEREKPSIRFPKTMKIVKRVVEDNIKLYEKPLREREIELSLLAKRCSYDELLRHHWRCDNGELIFSNRGKTIITKCTLTRGIWGHNSYDRDIIQKGRVDIVIPHHTHIEQLTEYFLPIGMIELLVCILLSIPKNNKITTILIQQSSTNRHFTEVRKPLLKEQGIRIKEEYVYSREEAVHSLYQELNNKNPYLIADNSITSGISTIVDLSKSGIRRVMAISYRIVDLLCISKDKLSREVVEALGTLLKDLQNVTHTEKEIFTLYLIVKSIEALPELEAIFMEVKDDIDKLIHELNKIMIKVKEPWII